jgi:hypothetical protein
VNVVRWARARSRNGIVVLASDWNTYSCHGKGGRDGALEVVGFLVLGTLGVGHDCETVSYKCASEVSADQKGSGVLSSALLMSFLVAIVAKSIDLMWE